MWKWIKALFEKGDITYGYQPRECPTDAKPPEERADDHSPR